MLISVESLKAELAAFEDEASAVPAIEDAEEGGLVGGCSHGAALASGGSGLEQLLERGFRDEQARAQPDRRQLARLGCLKSRAPAYAQDAGDLGDGKGSAQRIIQGVLCFTVLNSLNNLGFLVCHLVASVQVVLWRPN
jgi:hypothetical protein